MKETGIGAINRSGLRPPPISHTLRTFAARMLLTGRYTSFFSTHTFYEGLRITIGIMVPVLLAARYDEIGWGLAMALGALCVSLTDHAGPVHHRVNGMLSAIAFIAVSSLAIGYALPYQWLTILLLGFFSFFFSIIGIFGTRAASLGTSVLVGITLQLTDSDLGVWQNALLTAAGGTWYFLLSMALYRLRPYKLAQQVLADCILETGKFLALKARFYAREPDFGHLYTELLKAQVEVHNKQEVVREVLFKTRSIIKESTHTGRVLVMAFLETVDIFELVMTTEQDYRNLQKKLGEEYILTDFADMLQLVSVKIAAIAQALQEGRDADPGRELNDALYLLETRYENHRSLQMNASNAMAFNDLRHVITLIKDLVGRVQNLAVFSTYDQKLKLNRPVDYDRFVVPSYINTRLLMSNLNWQSNIFRYSVRMTIAVVAGYLLSLLFPLGHSYWILLTIVVILKPAYALTRKRNTERLLGTLVGGLLGVAILFLVKNPVVLLVLLIVFMVGAFSLMRTRYWESVALLTAYVLISIYLLKPGDYTPVFKDRLLDTFIGSVISFLFTRFIPPVWEKVQLKELIADAIRANRDFLGYILDLLNGTPIHISQYKWYRKETFVSLANVSDAFQRMLNEPKSRQEQGAFLHPLIVGCHLLASRSSALGRLVQNRPEPGYPEGIGFYKLLVTNLLNSATTLIDQPGASLEIMADAEKQLKEVMEEMKTGLMGSQAAGAKETFANPAVLISHLEGIAALSGELKRLAGKAAGSKN